jgi:hypothetical protein
VEFGGDFSVEHLTSTSAPDFLIGKRGLFLVAYVTEAANSIALRPILIGRRLFHLGDLQRPTQDDRFELHPSEVDAFRPAFAEPMASAVRPTKADLDPLRTMPERVVKEAFARIIGELDVAKDWGGEQSDLWTSRLKVAGKYLSAAFLFKGPAEFRPMKIRSLGANGDQIGRLANEPADILIVQHCHSVTSQVRRMLRVYALADWSHPRRYMIIDGYDTARILRHYGEMSTRRGTLVNE